MADRTGFAFPALPYATGAGQPVAFTSGSWLPLFDAGVGTPPIVTVVSPAPGTALEVSDPVVVDVTDERALNATRPIVIFSVGPYATEVVYDGNRFRAPYRGTVTGITRGYRLSYTRSGGWPSPRPRFEAIALDAEGNEAV